MEIKLIQLKLIGEYRKFGRLKIHYNGRIIQIFSILISCKYVNTVNDDSDPFKKLKYLHKSVLKLVRNELML